MSKKKSKSRRNSPYLETGSEEPTQLDLFDNNQLSPAVEAFERALKAVDEMQKIRTPTLREYSSNVLHSFNLYPLNSLTRHLTKASIKKSASEAIASDWNNVFEDLYGALVKQVQDEKRQSER